MKKAVGHRLRRKSEEARALILDAAEKRLIEGGPEALRLQDLARDLRISHPLILHHFGSREGLVGALIVGWLDRLYEQFKAESSAGRAPSFKAMLKRFRGQLE